ncbi:3'-5' exonuclease family protein [Tritrichomonas foetus]|uniref:3'-5' exonuclease family protein n=1 Tax=Tritrichomonas foetus TaxID=1144522 RepID=A0A1J4JZQ5_9EUKA|nr:3'-5' exonuclease family protein [Tritrichomonas foetus]|eukprot:OHT03968.1 3'-5' exonuclease family protein [Tritrichomonas foetus]
MTDDKVVSTACVLSPIMEELQAAYSAISALENCFLKNSNDGIDLTQFHTQIKRLSILTTNFYARNPSVKEIEDELSNQQSSNFVPCGVEAYHITQMETPSLIEANPVSPAPILSPPPETTFDVQMLNYPIISSVQFSLVDERSQLLSLIERINAQKEIAIELICFPNPLLLSAVCIALRECEYLVDVSEIPSAISDLKPVFSNHQITKVFFNTAQTCHLLHMFGVSDISNVFCISAAACALRLPPSLEELTAEFRNRLVEGWIPDGPVRISQPRVNPVKSEQRITKTVLSIESTAKDDWRTRPFSLSQMRIARQQMHYHLYLYDSLRLKLKEDNPSSLRDVFLISQHKASMDWSKYLYYLTCPNSMILCSIYQQPLPNAVLFKSLMALKPFNMEYLTDAIILSIALDVPTNEEELKKSIEIASPPRQLIFAKKVIQIPVQLQHSIFSSTSKAPTPQNKSSATKKTKTLDETIAELGWVQSTDPSQSPKQQPIDFKLDTTVSPRLVKSANGGPTVTGAYLRYLRDPDQPTSVSLQIEGIPKTEAQIYQLANNVRMIQKLQGKTKAKLPSGKDEPINEESPDEVLHNLVSIGYIDDEEAKKIKDKISVPKPQRTGSKRARSSDSKPQVQRRTGSQQYKRTRP